MCTQGPKVSQEEVGKPLCRTPGDGLRIKCLVRRWEDLEGGDLHLPFTCCVTFCKSINLSDLVS